MFSEIIDLSSTLESVFSTTQKKKKEAFWSFLACMISDEKHAVILISELSEEGGFLLLLFLLRDFIFPFAGVNLEYTKHTFLKIKANLFGVI